MENLRTIYSAKTFIVDHSIEMLILKRIDNNRWDLPGGELIGGEDPLQAAIREVYEETSIAIIEDCVMPVPDNPRKDKSIHYENIQHERSYFMGYIGKILIARPKIILSDEHKDLRWVKPLEAIGLLGHTVQRQALKAAFDTYMFRLPQTVQQN